MGDIYSRCVRCFVWIDHDPFLDVEYESDSDWSWGIGEDVFDFFRSFSDADPDDRSQPANGVGLREVSSASTSTSSQSRATKPDLHANNHLQWFFEHPWFRRVWVFQEFVLAPHTSFLIGNFILPGDEIERVFKFGWLRSATWFNALHQRLNMSKDHAALLHKAPGFEFFLSAIQSRQLYTAPEHPTVALASDRNRHIDGFHAYESIIYADILGKMGGSQASDNRDHVYAFIGMAPCLLAHMRVDYSLSVEETFAATMKALVKETKCLDFWENLPCEGDISKSELRLPSWVPNWTVYAPEYGILTHDNLFDACGPGYGLPSVGRCKHFDLPTSAWNELIAAGKIIDVVQIVLRPFSAYQVTPSIGVDFHDFSGNLPWRRPVLEIFLAELSRRGVTDNERISKKTLLRTLFMDGVQWAAIDASNSGESLYRTGQQIFGTPHHQKIDDVISVLIDSDEVDFDALPHGATVQTLHDLSRVQYQRRVAYCAGGRLALAPDLVEQGDVVAILHGSRTPVVLRVRSSGRYIVVGQCYYDGTMYGGMADSDDDAAEVFTLV